jgi:hypothetical protein
MWRLRGGGGDVTISTSVIRAAAGIEIRSLFDCSVTF